MRQQYHLRKVGTDFYIWDVNKLINSLKSIKVTKTPLSEISELNHDYWSFGSTPIVTKKIAEHAKLILECDLTHPILLCPERKLIDGMHRVCKAYIKGQTTIDSIILKKLPSPDYVNVRLEDLPYK